MCVNIDYYEYSIRVTNMKLKKNYELAIPMIADLYFLGKYDLLALVFYYIFVVCSNFFVLSEHIFNRIYMHLFFFLEFI